MHVQIYKDNKGKWRWRLVDMLGKVVLRSHTGHGKLLGAQTNARHIHKQLGTALRRPVEKV